uniref:Uncharacterized protein n=1 Tax=Sus scrofa TaxID=9823 RepID=A0A4X1VZC6_PIG
MIWWPAPPLPFTVNSTLCSVLGLYLWKEELSFTLGLALTWPFILERALRFPSIQPPQSLRKASPCWHLAGAATSPAVSRLEALIRAALEAELLGNCGFQGGPCLGRKRGWRGRDVAKLWVRKEQVLSTRRNPGGRGPADGT